MPGQKASCVIGVSPQNKPSRCSSVDPGSQLDGAYTFNGPDYAQVIGRVNGKPYAQWQASVTAVLRNNGKVAISLGGFDGATPAEQFMNAYRAGAGDDWTATQWEMQQVGRQVRLGNLDWSNVSFYDGEGNPVSIPEPQW